MKEEQTTVIFENVSKTHRVGEIAVPALKDGGLQICERVFDEARAAGRRGNAILKA